MDLRTVQTFRITGFHLYTWKNSILYRKYFVQAFLFLEIFRAWNWRNQYLVKYLTCRFTDFKWLQTSICFNIFCLIQNHLDCVLTANFLCFLRSLNNGIILFSEADSDPINKLFFDFLKELYNFKWWILPLHIFHRLIFSIAIFVELLSRKMNIREIEHQVKNNV